MTDRDLILSRIRTAVTRAPEPPPITRDYAERHHLGDAAELIDLLAENLTDYRAHVHRSEVAALPTLIDRLMAAHNDSTLADSAGPAARMDQCADCSR